MRFVFTRNIEGGYEFKWLTNPFSVVSVMDRYRSRHLTGKIVKIMRRQQQ